jgi:hypothetical protein
VYLNGLEIFRDDMPMTPADFTTTASSAVNGVQETSFFLAAQLPASALKEGTNVLAVEIHQNQPSSTDVSFDLALTATRFARPDLVVESTQGRPQLVWPALPGGFVLESASTLSADQGRWLEVTNAVTVEQRKRGLLPLNPEQTFQFYRLRKK